MKRNNRNVSNVIGTVEKSGDHGKLLHIENLPFSKIRQRELRIYAFVKFDEILTNITMQIFKFAN